MHNLYGKEKELVINLIKEGKTIPKEFVTLVAALLHQVSLKLLDYRVM